MKVSALRLFLTSVILMMNASVASNQVSTIRDGNWWIEQGEAVKLSYMTGFFDGIELGHDFSYWGYMDDYKAKKIMTQPLRLRKPPPLMKNLPVSI